MSITKCVLPRPPAKTLTVRVPSSRAPQPVGQGLVAAEPVERGRRNNLGRGQRHGQVAARLGRIDTEVVGDRGGVGRHHILRDQRPGRGLTAVGDRDDGANRGRACRPRSASRRRGTARAARSPPPTAGIRRGCRVRHGWCWCRRRRRGSPHPRRACG